MSVTRVAVIGVGSPFGEDQLGWQVVHYLQKRAEQNGSSHVEFLVEDRPGVTLLEKMQGYHQVVLVDAVLSDSGGGGLIHHFNQQKLISLSQNSLSSHATGVAEVVALGEALNNLPGQIDFVGLEVSGCGDVVDVDSVRRVGLEVEAILSA